MGRRNTVAVQKRVGLLHITLQDIWPRIAWLHSRKILLGLWILEMTRRPTKKTKWIA